MARYEVTKAWQGVVAGDIIETDTLHDALKPNVRQIADEKPEKVLEVASPRRGRPPKDKDAE